MLMCMMSGMVVLDCDLGCNWDSECECWFGWLVGNVDLYGDFDA